MIFNILEILSLRVHDYYGPSDTAYIKFHSGVDDRRTVLSILMCLILWALFLHQSMNDLIIL